MKRSCGGACVGFWWNLGLAGVWSQVVGFVLVRLAGMWLIAVMMFSDLIYFINK
jgi:hypothetical protein